MKRLMKFETFVPKRITNRDADAKEKDLFVFNFREPYQMTNGQTFYGGVTYNGSQSGDYTWLINLFALYSGRNLGLYLSLSQDWSDVVIMYDDMSAATEQFNSALWFAADNEVQRLATRIAMEMVHDMDEAGLGRLTTTHTVPQLYALVDTLQPKVLAALIKFKPTT